MKKKIVKTNNTQVNKRNYISEYFNSKRLQSLVSSLLIYFKTQNQQTNKQNHMQISILNSANISFLISRIKIYDNKIIQKQNNAIISFWKNTNHIFTTNNTFLNTSSKKQESTFKLRILSKLKSKTENDQISQVQKKQTIISKLDPFILIQQIYTGFEVFGIYESRLKDLNAFIDLINEILARKQYQKQNISYVVKTIFELRTLSKLIMKKLQQIKQCIEKHGNIFTQQNQLKEQNESKKNKQNAKYYNLKQHAKHIQQKLKQINEKYTLISKEIMAKEKQQKECYRYIIQNESMKININVMNRKHTQFSHQDQYLDEVNDNLLSVPDSMSSFRYQLSNKSILKTSKNNVINKLIEAKLKRGNNKRPSIEVITDIMQSKFTQSRFMHRDGINVGSGRTIEFGSKQPMHFKKKKAKKYVKIQANGNLQEQAMNINNSKRSSRSNIHNDLLNKGKVESERNSSKSKSKNKKTDGSFSEKRYYSYQQFYCRDSASSKSNSRSSTIIGQSTKKTKKRKNSCYFGRSKSFTNAKSHKKASSSKNIKSHSITPSLKKIIDQVIQYKKNGKRFIARSGKIISLKDVQDLQKYNEDDKHVNSKRFINMDLKKNKYKANLLNKNRQKQKYEQLHQNLHTPRQNELNSPKKVKEKPEVEVKSNRRLGMALPNNPKIQTETEKQIQRLKAKNMSNKTVSQTTSKSGSKKFYKSNNRIKYQENILPVQKKSIRTKTQQKIEQYCQALPQFKVNFDERFTFAEQFVKFYPNIECTLYKTTKKYQKQQQFLMNSQSGTQNLQLQMQAMPNFKVKKNIHQQNQLSIKQTELKKKMFLDQNEKIIFSRKFSKIYNQLEQKGFTKFKKQNRREMDGFTNNLGSIQLIQF